MGQVPSIRQAEWDLLLQHHHTLTPVDSDTESI